MGLQLGGDACWKKRRASGGLAIFYEWFEGEGAMFITRAHQSALAGNRGSAAITQPQAHLYADSKTGAPTPRLIQFAAKACTEIGLEASRMNIKAIADAIVDGLEDLVRMPPEPAGRKAKSGKPEGEIALLDGMGRSLVSGELVH